MFGSQSDPHLCATHCPEAHFEKLVSVELLMSGSVGEKEVFTFFAPERINKVGRAARGRQCKQTGRKSGLYQNKSINFTKDSRHFAAVTLLEREKKNEKRATLEV